MLNVVGADAVIDAEGNTFAHGVKTVDFGAKAPPGSESVARVQGLPRNLGGLVASGERLGAAARGKTSAVVATRSRSAAVGARKWGNRPDGTPRSEGRRREHRNREEERWERRRAHQPSQRNSNG